MDRFTRSSFVGRGGVISGRCSSRYSMPFLDGGWAGKPYKIQTQPVRNHRSRPCHRNNPFDDENASSKIKQNIHHPFVPNPSPLPRGFLFSSLFRCQLLPTNYLTCVCCCSQTTELCLSSQSYPPTETLHPFCPCSSANRLDAPSNRRCESAKPIHTILTPTPHSGITSSIASIIS